MALESRLELRLSQKLVLTPQLQQAIKLLQLPHLELTEFLNQEIMENPFLEETAEETPVDELTPEEKDSMEREEKESAEGEDTFEDTGAPLERLMSFSVDEYFEERSSDGRDMGYFNPGTITPPSFDQFLSKKPDIYDHLLWKLRLSHAPEELKKVGEMIIGNIDENGYLIASLEEITKAAETGPEEVEIALRLIQSFDPPGVGARTVVECLLLQLKALKLQGTIVEKIVMNHRDELEKKKS